VFPPFAVDNGPDKHAGLISPHMKHATLYRWS
jgi:hypothetical protein